MRSNTLRHAVETRKAAGALLRVRGRDYVFFQIF
jgi:hypothetical protein